jgi:threonine dehydrogenase-like Zn-dependent dehydrogenase
MSRPRGVQAGEVTSAGESLDVAPIARSRARVLVAGDPGPWGLAYRLSYLRLGVQRAVPGSALGVGLGALRPTPIDVNALMVTRPGWVGIRPLLAGVCGSDWGLLLGRGAPYLAPLTAFPAVLGHEIYGEVLQSGAWPAGTRVVVDPSLTCSDWGIAPCRACAAGIADGCERHAAADQGPGLLLGYHPALPGGWSTFLVAPAARVVPVPEGMDPRRAVLTEPVAIVLHGLDQVDWRRVGSALVVGGGPMGLMTIWAIRALHPDVSLAATVRYPRQAEAAEALGDARVLPDPWADRATLGSVIAGRFGAPAYAPWGYDLVVDAVGHAATLQAAAAVARPGGQVLVIGGAGRVTIDMAPVWVRTLRVLGTFGYGSGPENRFRSAVALLAATDKPIETLIGDVQPLSDYRRAMRDFWRHRHVRIKLAWAPPTGRIG